MRRKCDFQEPGAVLHCLYGQFLLYVFQESWVVLHSFYIWILQINLNSSLNWEIWPKVKLSAPIGLTRLMNRVWNRKKYGFQVSRVILCSFYAQLLLINIVSSFNSEVWPKSIDWPELGLMRAEWAQTGRKHDFQKPRVVLHNF